jgi:hypothetical protein
MLSPKMICRTEEVRHFSIVAQGACVVLSACLLDMSVRVWVKLMMRSFHVIKEEGGKEKEND